MFCVIRVICSWHDALGMFFLTAYAVARIAPPGWRIVGNIMKVLHMARRCTFIQLTVHAPNKNIGTIIRSIEGIESSSETTCLCVEIDIICYNHS